MGPLGTFIQFYQTATMETMTVRKDSTSVFAMYFQALGVSKVSFKSYK